MSESRFHHWTAGLILNRTKPFLYISCSDLRAAHNSRELRLSFAFNRFPKAEESFSLHHWTPAVLRSHNTSLIHRPSTRCMNRLNVQKEQERRCMQRALAADLPLPKERNVGCLVFIIGRLVMHQKKKVPSVGILRTLFQNQRDRLPNPLT
jgi:hypothetical protein